MTDRDPPYILEVRRALLNRDVVGLGDRAVRVRGRGEFACAVFGVGGEVVEPLDAIQRHTYDGRARGRELPAGTAATLIAPPPPPGWASVGAWEVLYVRFGSAPEVEDASPEKGDDVAGATGCGDFCDKTFVCIPWHQVLGFSDSLPYHCGVEFRCDGSWRLRARDLDALSAGQVISDHAAAKVYTIPLEPCLH